MTRDAPDEFPYERPPELAGGRAPRRRPVVVVGAGPVGLAAAIDLASRGVPVVVLEEDASLATGSRAICWAKRTLEIFDRLGCAAEVVGKGITWNRGKVFFRDALVYEFDLLPEAGHKFPAFVNLQQYTVERTLVDRATSLGCELRWRSRVVGLEAGDAGVRLRVETPDGTYALESDWLVAADGVKSTVRRLLGLDVHGQVFDDRFLITDVRMKADFPTERWFWFDPPFHSGHSALLHRQADDVFRIDLQLGRDADPEEERRPERVRPRIEAMLGAVPFEIEWVSVYTFRCRRLARFRHGRVLFAGDAAHEVSPFGARGGNGGIQDVDNLCWKLALVLAGDAPETLLDSYDEERIPAADENIRHSTRATDFITPKSAASRELRDAVLSLAATAPFARRLVNSGRLSTPHVVRSSALLTPDADAFDGGVPPGAPAADAPVEGGWLLERIGPGFTALLFADGAVAPAVEDALETLERGAVPIRTIVVTSASAPAARPPSVRDVEGVAARRYDAAPGSFLLIRPDQHVAARWRAFDVARTRAALARALGKP